MFAIKNLGSSKGNWLNKLWYMYKTPYGYQKSCDKFICTHKERRPKTAGKHYAQHNPTCWLWYRYIALYIYTYTDVYISVYNKYCIYKTTSIAVKTDYL